VVEIAITEDLGKAITQAVAGPDEGGIAQGLAWPSLRRSVSSTARSAARRSPTT
jgi:hypothetical protein